MIFPIFENFRPYMYHYDGFSLFFIMLVSRTTDCTLQEIGEYAVSSEDIKRKYETSPEACKTDCVNSPQCRALYYINRKCFIIHKEAQRVKLIGSSFFKKNCHGIYCQYMYMQIWYLTKTFFLRIRHIYIFSISF